MGLLLVLLLLHFLERLGRLGIAIVEDRVFQQRGERRRYNSAPVSAAVGTAAAPVDRGAVAQATGVWL